jgi:hypothetical protein
LPTEQKLFQSLKVTRYNTFLQSIKAHDLVLSICYIPFSMSSQLFLTIFLHCSLSCDVLFQWVTPGILRSVVTASSHFSSVFPSSSFLLLLPVALSSHVSVLALYQHDPATLFCTILMCMYRSFIALFVFLLHPPSSVLVPLNIFLSSFLSHVSSFISLFFVNTQVSHPYTTAGLTTVLYILIFAGLEISLDVSILFSEPIALLPLLILLSITSSSSLSYETVAPRYSKRLTLSKL